MNWFKKTSSFIDTVQVISYTGYSLVLYIDGKRYKYIDIPGSYYAGEIERWKKHPNKKESGNKLSVLIKNLNKYLEKNRKYAMSTDIIKQVSQDLDIENLGLSNIFGDKYRIAIPYYDDYLKDLKSRIESDGNWKVDFEKQVAYKKTKTNFGEKWQTVRLGKAVQLVLGEEEWKTFNQKTSGLSSLSSSEYAIILSRHPIDVLRMSDHDGIHSCHAEGGSYFHCAKLEAVKGGGISYLVRKEDLSKISENLQDEEIFEDTDRRVDGIAPLSRIRIRRFRHDLKDYDLAIPEDRAYGKRISGFDDSVMSFLREKQSDIIKSRPRVKDFKLFGGSYQDTQAGKLFNEFFDDDIEDDNKTVKLDDESGESLADIWQEEIDRKLERNRSLQYSSVYAEASSDDGNAYMYSSIYISFDLSKFEMSRELNRNELYAIEKELNRFISNFIISEIDLQDGKIILNCHNDYVENPDDLDGLFDDLEEFEEKEYEGSYNIIFSFLAKNNLINNQEYINNYSIYSKIKQEHLQDADYDNEFNIKYNLSDWASRTLENLISSGTESLMSYGHRTNIENFIRQLLESYINFAGDNLFGVEFAKVDLNHISAYFSMGAIYVKVKIPYLFNEKESFFHSLNIILQYLKNNYNSIVAKIENFINEEQKKHFNYQNSVRKTPPQPNNSIFVDDN